MLTRLVLVLLVSAIVVSGWVVASLAVPRLGLTQYCARPYYTHVSEFETVLICDSGLVVRIAR